MTEDDWEESRRLVLTRRARVGWMTLERSTTPTGQYAHGTRYGYAKKRCRCEACVDWSREYRRERYAATHPYAKPRPKARKS